ncbi:unnamed protein product [Laminaria digitata]
MILVYVSAVCRGKYSSNAAASSLRRVEPSQLEERVLTQTSPSPFAVPSCASFSDERPLCATNPHTDTFFALMQDEETIRRTLKKSGLRIYFRAVVATPSRVGEILNDGCQMIHYVGHGDEECLSFESDNDRQCGVMEPL